MTAPDTTSPVLADRRRFVMSQEQLDLLLEASKPVPYLITNGIGPASPRDCVNKAWRDLGEVLGFEWDSAHPDGPDARIFTAITKASVVAAQGAGE